jgi:hypothetical protein
MIWNELWPPFSDLISAHEAADVPKGQNMVRTWPTQIFLENPTLYLLPNDLVSLECYIVRNRGPLPFSAGDSFSFNVGDRGARGHS